MFRRIHLLLILLLVSILGLLPGVGAATASAAPVPSISISGPATALRGSTVSISGTAIPAGSVVSIHFHRKGQPAAYYAVMRVVRSDASGHWSTSFRPGEDNRYYATANGRQSRSLLIQVTFLSISGPLSAPQGSTVTIRGKVLPVRSGVLINFHRRGQVTGVFDHHQRVPSSADGSWSTTFRADTDEFYYATAVGLHSVILRTLASPVAVKVPVYAFPIRPAGVVDYAHVHHDYPATDMFAPCQSDVVAVTDGVVQEVSRVDVWNPITDNPAVRGGLSISVVGDDGVRYYMAHLHDILAFVGPGVRVTHGQLLAHVGQTGNAVGLGCHVHFGMSPPCGPGEWSIRRGTFYPWPYLDSWRSGGQSSPVAAMRTWLAAHRAECAAHRLAGT